MSGYVKSVITKAQPHVGPINASFVKSWGPILTFWGGAALFGVFTFTENWPLFQQTFYQKIPVFGSYWIEDVDPEDLPH